ncbi:vWA domain-containing protein [Flavihumibacter sp. UBA7668]|uniref:vWA domain-containing protein n=1 Tax=Flavihumibacter sp. UBA7668 TaxID=1946542 RepID=UPI0025B7A958|nr:vWA domain-containing protein [Flavihumibacter sp. UBA7668]
MPTRLIKTSLLAGALLLCSGIIYTAVSKNKPHSDPFSPHPSRKIQVAILLDVSNSMDGLISQAKAQLWNMVSILGKSSCDGYTPKIEIALYEYGRSSNKPSAGYVEQITPFTTDLDEVSRQLFRLSTMGGDEYCGQVMYNSLNELKWEDGPDHYKVIFIAGNEDFLQGNLPFTKACSIAKQKKVVVNTIYCGDRMQGMQEHWNLGAECGNGSFTHINSDAAIDMVATPYDDRLFELNKQLNNTYIGYGALGRESKAKQEEADVQNYSMSKEVAADRVAVKGKKSLYKNTQWDLVDAQEADPQFYNKVDKATLPEMLKNKSRAEIKIYIDEQTAKRNQIRKELESVQLNREKFITAEKTKKSGKSDPTLATEIEKIIRDQARRTGILIQ